MYLKSLCRFIIVTASLLISLRNTAAQRAITRTLPRVSTRCRMPQVQNRTIATQTAVQSSSPVQFPTVASGMQRLKDLQKRMAASNLTLNTPFDDLKKKFPEMLDADYTALKTQENMYKGFYNNMQKKYNISHAAYRKLVGYDFIPPKAETEPMMFQDKYIELKQQQTALDAALAQAQKKAYDKMSVAQKLKYWFKYYTGQK